MFESSLVALDRKRNSRGVRWIVLTTTIVAQLLGLTGLLLAQYWQVTPVEEPPVNAVFTVQLQLELAAAAAAPRPAAAPAAPTPRVEGLRQPLLVPDKPPVPTAEPQQAPAADPDPAAVAPSVSNGPPGGFSSRPPGDSSGDGSGSGSEGLPGGAGLDEPLHVGGAVSRPEKISTPPPVYTEAARKARLQGVEIIEAIIDAQGNVVGAHVIKGLQLGLDRAALDAVERWKFRPATLGGKPVKVYYTLTVNFQVQ